MKNSVVIIGGGLAGLISAILLKRGGMEVCVIEKNEYPFHRVCGEYVSNEVIPFLQENELWPEELHPADITRFELSDTSGENIFMPLDLGGFGISRYALDNFFAEKARECGVDLQTGTRAEEVHFNHDRFFISTRDQEIEARYVIGAYGKRSHLDKRMNRSFMERRSPYIGVKYHIKNAPHEADTVALHNFEGGYCGVNAVENNTFNLCYLSHRDNLREHRDISRMEQEVLYINPHIRKIFEESEMLWKSPLVINEISFETKEPVVQHILMCGDAAGMITPLCGNGMAMAIHSAKILAQTVLDHQNDRDALERAYAREWNRQFSFRLSSGRQIQRLFGRPAFSRIAVGIGKFTPPVARYMMSMTHGAPFT